jgi:hypothetical protein
VTTESTVTEAQSTEAYAVMSWDKHDRLVLVTTTPELAQQYINGLPSDEGMSVKPVVLVSALPPAQPYYSISFRVGYDPDKPERTVDEDEQSAFPGLYNGMGLDEISSSLTEYRPYGWDISVSGWNLEGVRAWFQELRTQAYALRDERHALHARFAAGTKVRTPKGLELMRVIPADGRPAFWRSPGDVAFRDDQVAPDQLTVIEPGQ